MRPPANSPVAAKPKPTSGSSNKAKYPDVVTPEQAQKLYNRPKTNPPPKVEPGSPFPRIGAEFERQRAILISVSELLPQHGKVFTRLADLTRGHVPLVVLFNNAKQLKMAVDALEPLADEADSPDALSHVYFQKLEMNTVWLRDFGPIFAEQKTGAMAIDFFYSGERPIDDRFPERWSEKVGTSHNSVPWTLQGGNLLSNGAGLAITTARVFDDNKIQFNTTPGRAANQDDSRAFVIEEIKKYTHLDEIVVLEPLREEATRHVDMFATFVARDRVLVAKLDPRRDPVNARILDFNARKLSQVKIDGKSLDVVRIPIPVRRGKSWSPYTNIIMANKLVLMPVLNTDDRRTVEAAINVYRKVLPDHRVATVDISSMANLQGALHCMSVNVPHFAPMPDKVISWKRAREWAAGDVPEE